MQTRCPFSRSSNQRPPLPAAREKSGRLACTFACSVGDGVSQDPRAFGAPPAEGEVKTGQLAMCLRSSPREVDDQGNDHDNQESVNQPSRDVECKPTEDPSDK